MAELLVSVIVDTMPDMTNRLRAGEMKWRVLFRRKRVFQRLACKPVTIGIGDPRAGIPVLEGFPKGSSKTVFGLEKTRHFKL